jgi:hypothetical protein
MVNWKVFVDGKDTGIVESNLADAFPYWAARKRETCKSIKLVAVKRLSQRNC